MTGDINCLPDGSHLANRVDTDIVASLWEEVPFPRLPLDAPAEIKELVIDIENPRRVYTIHRACRRHYLQLLVERFVVQLRHGCGSADCTTPSCLSCRKRLAGKAPLRRYSPTSARTLAVHMAGQDNPESRLCPRLQTPKEPSDSVKPVVFKPKAKPGPAEPSRTKSFKSSGEPSYRNAAESSRRVANRKRELANILESRKGTASYPDSSPNGKVSATKAYGYESSLSSNAREQRRDFPLQEKPFVSKPTQDPQPQTNFTIVEKPSNPKDYRSFAANVFGTFAFKMLEWLTPNSLEALSQKLETSMDRGPFPISAEASPALSELEGNSAARSMESLLQNQAASSDSGIEMSNGSLAADIARDGPLYRTPDHRSTEGQAVGNRPPPSRRNSNAKVRKPSVTKSQSFSEGAPEEPTTGLASSRPSDKVTKELVRTASTMTRTPSHISIDQPLDNLSDGQTSDKMTQSPKEDQSPLLDGATSDHASNSWDNVTALDTSAGSSDWQQLDGLSDESQDLDSMLPQSLAYLTLQAVDFCCDVLQEDATSEKHLLEPQSTTAFDKRSPNRVRSWRRKSMAVSANALDSKSQWKQFIEQSIFNVLSDPHAIIRSFTTEEGVLDSQALFHCMLRMTRVAPSLVFDSLWIAAASLFTPPASLHSLRPSATKGSPRGPKPLTDEEASLLVSICFHALAAAAPLVSEYQQLSDMSRIRSHGLILAGGSAIANQSSNLCAQYEDAFSDDMSLRLARRVLSAIPTRRYFEDLFNLDLDLQDDLPLPNILGGLISQLELQNGETQSLLDLSLADREMHEKRIKILILDWARTIMINEWDGKPEVSGDGPFGGALALIEAMYHKRQPLLLGDVYFRADYLGERLDAVEMPVAWVDFTSSRQKVHLLDYPFMFNPASLVSYFRAINFSRMSRSYEESASLQSRITAIVATDSLVREEHQQSVLKDLLKVPSAKYLILDIGRKEVIRDAFDQLWRREQRELMRPLKIHLGEDSGEEGFDSGGVQQEFFRLAIAEALNPEFGAFTVDDRTRMTWFQPGSLQPEWKFELIGLLMSLAVYNGLTLPITFPKALYRKLLGEPVTELHHISDGWPDLADGLTQLLEWDENDGLVEDIFARTYEFSISMFGQPISREMEPSTSGVAEGSSIPSWPQFSSHSAAQPASASNPEDAPMVTGDNRNAYVSDYIRYLTDVSIAPQYAAFERGFRRCLHTKSLTLLTPNLLQSIVEGTQEIDVSELRRAARYVGWDASHRTVRDFWSIVKRYDERMRRKLLEFVTASDRVPVGGMKNVQFVVQKNGEEGAGGHLPTAYTCYGTLLLPEYRDKEVLRERLAMALENAQGFGFA